jgi:ribonuclease P protein component
LIDPIRDRESFVRLRREGRRVRIDPLWCSFVLIPDLDRPQVAFAIGRAVGPAVVRNRLRRRLRAILGSSVVPPGLYLVGVSRPIPEHTFAELAAVTQSLLDRVAPP